MELNELITQEANSHLELYQMLLTVKANRSLSQSEKNVFLNVGACIASRARYMRKQWSDAVRDSQREGETSEGDT